MSKALWNQAKRLLVLRLDGLGDLLMTGPAIRALKAASPHRSITVLASPNGADCARLMPGVDDVIVFEAPWMKGAKGNPFADTSMIERLKGLDFDGAVIFTVFSQSPLPAAFFCYLVGIPLRAAYCRENPYQLLTDWLPEPERYAPTRHEVERQLELARALGASSQGNHLAMSLPSAGLPFELDRKRGQPLIIVHPGASAPSRCYPEESYAEVLRLLEKEEGAYCVLTGSEYEEALLWRIKKRAQSSAPILSQLALEEFAALIDSADLLVANNSGPAHVAAAVATPVVVLYALTNPQHTPWGVLSEVLSVDVPCRNCYKSECPEGHHRCLRDIHPRRVVEAAVTLLGQCRAPILTALC